jgi:hypothetical protein
MWGFGPMYRFYFNRYRSSATPSGWVVDACDVEDFLVNVQRFYELGPTDRWALSSHDPRGPAGGFTIDVTELQSTSVIAEWLGKVGAGAGTTPPPPSPSSYALSYQVAPIKMVLRHMKGMAFESGEGWPPIVHPPPGKSAQHIFI